MRTSRKDRRSERIPATHRLMLSILGSSGAEVLKEIVTTVEISQHGARLRGRRTLQQNWQGILVQLSSGRQASCRVVWQIKAASAPEYLESGVELLANFDFWGRTFSNPDAESAGTEIVIETAGVPPEEILKELRKSPQLQGQEGERVLEAVWCGLLEQLEERKVITRPELVASIRKIAQP